MEQPTAKTTSTSSMCAIGLSGPFVSKPPSPLRGEESRQGEKEAYSALLQAMGVCQSSEVTLSDELEKGEFAVPSFEDAVAEAYSNRPDIFRASIQTDMAKEGVREVRSRYLPRLNAFYNYSRRYAGAWDDQWQAGLRLSWTLFDGLAREGAMIQRKAYRNSLSQS